MKQIIAHFDKIAPSKPKERESTALNFTQLASSQLFENFGKSDPKIPSQESKVTPMVNRVSFVLPMQ